MYRILTLVLLSVGALCAAPPLQGSGCGYYQPAYYPPTYNNYSYPQYNYITPVIATYIPIAVPQYSISYIAPTTAVTTTVQTTAVPQVQATVAAAATTAQAVQQQAAPASTCDQKLVAVQNDMLQLQKQMLQCQQQMLQMQSQGVPQIPSQQAAPSPPSSTKANGPVPTPVNAFGSILVAKCAACHDARTAETEGKGLVLVKDGKPVQLTPIQASKVITQSYTGKMPKKVFASGKPCDIAPLTDEEVSALVAYVDQMK